MPLVNDYVKIQFNVVSTIEDNTPVPGKSLVRKLASITVIFVGDHNILRLEHRRARNESISISLVKNAAVVRGVDLFIGQIYQGSWGSDAMVPILNILKSRYTLSSINDITLILKASDSLTSQIDIQDDDIKVAMISALVNKRAVTIFIYVFSMGREYVVVCYIQIMGQTKVNTLQSV
ncbi:hypothetical protein BGZ47_001073 [Haplosporangium gracile]|nr:hypothetical protein BGZ47_001073 [Haplosporangium gracile]